MQKRKHSILEILASTAIGFAISLSALYFIFPFFGIESTHSKNLGITIFFTVISIIRGYFVRRLFNKKASTATFTSSEAATLKALCFRRQQEQGVSQEAIEKWQEVIVKLNKYVDPELYPLPPDRPTSSHLGEDRGADTNKN